MSLLKNNDWFDIVLEGTKINENDDITESRNKLNKFKSIDLNKNNLEKFKNEYKNLSHVRIDENTIGKLYTDNDNVVGMINIESKSNGEKWIQGLEIFGKYKGTGLSLGLLDIGVKDLGAKYLSVRKTNTIAQKIYKKYGFIVYKSDDYMDYMKLSGYTKESPEFDSISDSVFENSDVGYNKNHKRNTGKYFKYLPYYDKRAKSMIFNQINIEMNQKMLGEIAIDSKTDTYAGYVSVTKSGILDEMFVEEEFRGYGIGDQFVTDAINKYGANTVDVLDDNYIAIELYKKHGFKEYKRYTNGNNKLITMKLENTIYDKKLNKLKNYNEGVDIMMNESIKNNEIFEEGFNHNRKKFDRSIRKTRKKTNGYYGTMSEKDVVKCGYDPIPKALINKLNSDAKWIRSEFIKEYNKIKDNNIIDTDDNMKLSDIVKIENGDTTVSYTTYLQNRVSGFVYTSISVAVMAPNENSNNDLDYQICDKYIRKVTSIFKDIKDTIEDKYYNKNNGKDTFDIEIDSTSDNPDYVDDDYGDACVARFSLCFEMTLRRHVNESVYDEIDEFDTFVEGANLDIIKELHKAKKEDKKSLKKISKAINEGKYKDARKYFNEYKKSAEKSISYIRSIDMNSTEKGINDILYGIVLFLNTSLNIGCTLLMSMIKPIATVGTTAGLVYTITKFVNNVYKTNKEYKNLKENNINVGAYQVYISNKLKELEENIRYIDMTILEYDGDEDIYNKYKEESVNIMMDETINNDEIFEESYKLNMSEHEIEKIAKIFEKELNKVVNKFNKSKKQEIRSKIDHAINSISKSINSSDDRIKKRINEEFGQYEKETPKLVFKYTGHYNDWITLSFGTKYQNVNIILSDFVDIFIKEFKSTSMLGKMMKDSTTGDGDTGNLDITLYSDKCKEYLSGVKDYKESVTDNFNDLELDYIFGNITESEYNRIKEENAIGQMLPQVPLNGETLSKTPDVESDVENLDNFINDADGVLKGEVDEFVKEYVTDKDCTFDVYLEASISKLVNRVVNRVKIPNKHARIIVNKAILKAKCKMLGNQTIDEKDIKVIDAKKRLINEEQEYRKIMKNLDNETKKQVEEVSKKIEKEVEDDLDVDDIVTNDKLTNKSNKNTEGKKLSTKDDDNYIKNIDSELKHLETVRPVKNPDEENKDYTRRLKKWEDKKYNLEMKKAKLQANFMREYVDNNPTELYSSDPEYRLIIEKQELEHYLETAQKNNNIDSIRKYENKLKLNRLQIAKESVETTEIVLLEAAAIEDDIKPIIDILNSKGYHTKYSSPGHHHLRRKEDADHNGVYNGKLYSDARLMFDDDYKSIPEAPKYWYTRQVDNCVYLDVKPITYNPNDGTPDEAFGLWKDKYMSSLAEWAKEIRTKPGPKEGKQKEEVKEESVYDIDNNLNEIMESVLGDLELDLALDI